MNILRARPILTLVALVCAFLLSEGAVFAQGTAGSASFGPVDLTVQVDQTFCASGPGQCTLSDPFHTNAAAANSNHNPVMLGLQVLSDGEPVIGLPKSAFTISYPAQVVPSLGPFLKVVSCVQNGTDHCFGGPLLGDGIYFILVDPIPVGMNWKSGNYLFQVQVTYTHPKKGPMMRRVLARIDIP